MINIGLLGFGAVGTGVYEIFNEEREKIQKAIGEEFNIKKILVRNLEKRAYFKDFSLLTKDIEDIINDPEIDLIIEVTGDVEEIYPKILKAIRSQKNIITANKALVSKYYEDLLRVARDNKIKFLFDSAVGGTIPILEALKNITIGNEVESVLGVLNGTCNFILSKMEEGLSYDEALEIAKDLGFAEADPSADVDGHDTLRKLRILSTIAFNESVFEDEISLEGISKISLEDVKNLSKENKRYKLIGRAKKENGKIIASVRPEIVEKTSMVGTLFGGENIIIVKGNNCGEISFKGLGAGPRPTGYSIIGDFLNIYKVDD